MNLCIICITTSSYSVCFSNVIITSHRPTDIVGKKKKNRPRCQYNNCVLSVYTI